MIVAMLALFVAMGGTAIAASSALITGKQIKNSSITGLDIKNKSVTSADIKGQLRGARGATGSTGAKGDKGDKGDPGAAGALGAPGAPGTARAYGHVAGGNPPTLDTAHSKNIVAVTRVLQGVYCVQAAAGISSTDSVAVVSVDWGASSSTNPAAHSHPGFNCPAGQFEVITRDNEATTAGAYSDAEDFYIIIG
jgi:hypothetical protein